MTRLHLGIGVTGIVAFLLTGQYMDHALGHLAGVDALPRMLYRSAHIYLLFASLLNVLAGLSLQAPTGGWTRGAARTGSAFLLITPVLMLLAFFYEPARTDFERPFAGFGTYACFAGVLLHLLAHAGNRSASHATAEQLPGVTATGRSGGSARITMPQSN